MPPDTRFDWLPGAASGVAAVDANDHSDTKEFNSTKGYPGEGPRPARVARPDADLLSRPQVSREEKTKRKRMILELRAYAPSHGIDLAECFAIGPSQVADVLRHFGQSLYSDGRPLGDFRTTINGVVDFRRNWGRSLTSAWDVVTAWEFKEPVEHHIPIPKTVFRATFAVALLARDTPFGVVIVGGYIGGLRPGEAIGLRRCDFVLPVDRGLVGGPVYIVVRHPGKARGGRGRRVQAQHVKISDPDIVRFLTWALAGLPRDAPVWSSSPAAFSRRWRVYIEDVLQLSASSTHGFCPASLRAGCATELYEATHDLVLVQWQLRHQDLTTLQSYVQELPMAMAQAALTPDQRARVGRLSSSADLLLRRTVAGLEGAPIARAPWIAVRRRPKARSRSAPAPAARITDGSLIAESRPLSMLSLGDLSDSD